MNAARDGGRTVVCDLRVVQSPDYRGRGVARWAYELALALERVRPDLVGGYLLDPTWPPPGAVDELLGSRKLLYAGTAQAEEALGRAGAYHCFSPFEPSLGPATLRPEAVERNGLAFSVTVHDLIPLRRPDDYLSDLSEWRSYMAKLELVRGADAVLAVSGAAAEEAISLLGLEPNLCHVVGAGTSRHFEPPQSRLAALAAAELATGVKGPFVLCLSGSQGRRNIPALIEAFSQLPTELAATYQLVIAGELPHFTAEHYRQIARQHQVEDALLLTGYVSEEALRLLYQATDLFVLPSLAELQGGPVGEATACGAPVALSDSPLFGALVPEPAARFDPTDAGSISAVMSRLLADEELRGRVVVAAAASLSDWDEAGRRAGAAFDSLLSRRRRPPLRSRRRPPRRPRLAILSPLPPLLSGVADYSGRLVEALSKIATARGDFSIELFADGLDRYRVDSESLAARQQRDARTFRAIDAATGYERVLYVLGNSDCHAAALAALRARPGVVMTHDIRLSGLMTFSAELPGAVPGGLRAAIERAYGSQLPPEVGLHGSLSTAEEDRYGLYLLREVAPFATKLLVSSESARSLAELDLGPGLSERLSVLPFAMSRLSGEEQSEVARLRSEPKPRPLVASFGILDPGKRPELVLRAVAALAARGREVDLAFVGQAADGRRHALESLAAELGVSRLVRVLPGTSRQEYVSLLGRADIAVQLRRRYAGEASGTVSECLSAGLATVVSEIGWMAELPSAAVAKVPPLCGAEELASTIAELLDDAERAARMGRAGRSYAATRTFEAAAEALLGELAL